MTPTAERAQDTKTALARARVLPICANCEQKIYWSAVLGAWYHEDTKRHFCTTKDFFPIAQPSVTVRVRVRAT